MSFLDELQKTTNRTRTENNAATNISTLDPLLDFFSLAGAMRNDVPGATRLFEKAYFADKQTAMRTLFYLRDIRGGQGERDLFRGIMKDVAQKQPDVFKQVVALIPEYGRWDDLLELFDYAPKEISAIIAVKLGEDTGYMETGKPVSLLAKWLPSVKASSAESRALATKIAFNLGLTGDPITLSDGRLIQNTAPYRRKIGALRKYIKLLEQKMSANEWDTIEYGKLPSQAGRKHVKAFKRHDQERYEAYLAAAVKGEAKMNTKTLYTYEVFDTVQHDVDAANAMWANLPDWTNGQNAIVLADVSGSMSGRPMSVSVSLALYFAEHNKGAFKNCFMTFSVQPQVVKVVGNTLAARLRNIENRAWDGNTNLEAALDALLDAAKKSPEDAPKILYIISDMEFDEACARPDATLFENAVQNYADAGIDMPHVVFWNVNARQQQAPATKFDNRVTLISGLSQSTFRYAVEGKTPLELMEEVINSERYAPIVVA